MSAFEEFQQSEYQHIADAHFKAIESISSFFRYYLLVMALPVPVVAAVFGLSSHALKTAGFVPAIFVFAGIFAIAVSIAGFCVLVQIVSLKMDVALYSRVVNAIRKYHYDKHDIDHANKLMMRQLPQSASFPAYWDLPFTFIVLAFAIFDTLYLLLGSHLLLLASLHPKSIYDVGFERYSAPQLYGLGLAGVVAFLGHFAAHAVFSWHREHHYLRGRALGVDIDGVLNLHREHFCGVLAAETGIRIEAAAIRLLPVHENEDLGVRVTRNDERRVFNKPAYWVEMPVMPGAADAIKSIRTSLSLPIHVFTHRPWPDTGTSSAADRELWRSAAQHMGELVDAKVCVRVWVWAMTTLNYRSSLTYITRYWLKSVGIPFDSLLVERGNENLAYTRGRYVNRFSYAKRKKIRFFVEDDWVKAIKLAYICDIVFLIDHPYNHAESSTSAKHHDKHTIGELPANVVRVTSWLEIKKFVNQLV